MKKKQPQFIIRDAESFYQTIKSNPLYDGLDDAEIIEALDAYFRPRVSAASADGLEGIARDRYMFFQGMLSGCLVAWKQIRHHIAAEAAKSNINPETGEPYGQA
jgi:hypothetical protein